MTIELNETQRAMLAGERGPGKQMAMRLVLDMAAAAGAAELLPIESAHLSGVSPLTGGLGLRQFLARLATDPLAQVAVPTTLNSAGCDAGQFAAMRIAAPEFLEHSQEIVALYTQLGVQPTQSCIPYEWEGVVSSGPAAWAESNAICYGNSYSGLLTNRESGLSALAAALTGYTPRYGLLEADARRPNLEVVVACDLDDPTDFSILGDWIGMQRRPGWQMPLGPIPLLRGLPAGHDLVQACTLNGRCEVVCPASIPLPTLLRELRERRHEAGLETRLERTSLRAWAWLAKRPRWYRRLTGLDVRIGHWLQGRGWIPDFLVRRWTRLRTLPPLPRRSFFNRRRAKP